MAYRIKHKGFLRKQPYWIKAAYEGLVRWFVWRRKLSDLQGASCSYLILNPGLLSVQLRKLSKLCLGGHQEAIRSIMLYNLPFSPWHVLEIKKNLRKVWYIRYDTGSAGSVPIAGQQVMLRFGVCGIPRCLRQNWQAGDTGKIAKENPKLKLWLQFLFHLL